MGVTPQITIHVKIHRFYQSRLFPIPFSPLRIVKFEFILNNKTMGCSSSQMKGSSKSKGGLVTQDSCATVEGNVAMPGNYKSVPIEQLDAQQPRTTAEAYRQSRGNMLGRADSTVQI